MARAWKHIDLTNDSEVAVASTNDSHTEDDRDVQ